MEFLQSNDWFSFSLSFDDIQRIIVTDEFTNNPWTEDLCLEENNFRLDENGIESLVDEKVLQLKIMFYFPVTKQYIQEEKSYNNRR